MKITKNLMSQDTLLADLGLTDFDAKDQHDLFDLMMDILEIKVLDAVLSELSDAEQKEFTLILLGENTDAAREFLDKRIKNLDTILDKVVSDFKQELIEDVLKAKKELLKG